MIKNFLEISNLSKSYFDNGEEIRILRNMNLTLADNQIVSLLGDLSYNSIKFEIQADDYILLDGLNHQF